MEQGQGSPFLGRGFTSALPLPRVEDVFGKFANPRAWFGKSRPGPPSPWSASCVQSGAGGSAAPGGLRLAYCTANRLLESVACLVWSLYYPQSSFRIISVPTTRNNRSCQTKRNGSKAPDLVQRSQFVYETGAMDTGKGQRLDPELIKRERKKNTASPARTFSATAAATSPTPGSSARKVRVRGLRRREAFAGFQG